jgi:hypothetical protein
LAIVRSDRRAGKNLQQRWLGRTAGELAGRGPVGRRGVGEPVEQLVECFLAVVDGSLLVVGERDCDEHPLQVGLGLEQLCPRGVLRDVEVALGAGHAVLALLEEGVGAQPVAEVVVLPCLACGGVPGGDGVTVDEDLDRADVPLEVACGARLLDLAWADWRAGIIAE